MATLEVDAPPRPPVLERVPRLVHIAVNLRVYWLDSTNRSRG